MSEGEEGDSDMRGREQGGKKKEREREREREREKERERVEMYVNSVDTSK